jgi:tRNA pseudouridine55 synthase
LTEGLIVVDKPAGPTSHDVVARMRRLLGERRIGHTGTLDPMATGVLPLVLGRATRLARFLSGSDKSYEAVVRLGIATDSGDAAGAEIGPRHQGPLPGRDEIDGALGAFRGTFLQQPPAFSAKKIGGRRSYRLARAAAQRSRTGTIAAAGDVSELPAPVPVAATRVDIVSVEDDRVTLAVDCSAGFYVRSLARDLGDRLGTGAHLVALRRTRSGDCSLSDAIPLHVAEDDVARARLAVVPMARMLPRLPALVLTTDGVRHATQGRNLGPSDIVVASSPNVFASPDSVAAEAWVRLMDSAGEFVGVGQIGRASGLLHPSVVLR